MQTWILRTAIAASVLFFTQTQADEGHNAAVTALLKSKIMEWVADPAIQNAIREKNQFNAKLTQADIDGMDVEWKQEFKVHNGKLISSIVDSDVSAILRKRMVDSNGLITEVCVMDARGLNVAAAEATSDYWQGDEPKWQKTFPVGINGLFIDEPKYDESAQTTQIQASMTIVDALTKAPIGAITVGVNTKKLK
jgi:hypothetical protein